MSHRIDYPRLIALLTERFPEVEPSQGFQYLEMTTLARATQAAIDNQDKTTVEEHFQFVDDVLRDAAPDVENAVKGYLENLRFEAPSAAPTNARNLLPPRLSQALAELEDFHARVKRSQKLQAVVFFLFVYFIFAVVLGLVGGLLGGTIALIFLGSSSLIAGALSGAASGAVIITVIYLVMLISVSFRWRRKDRGTGRGQ